MIEQGDELNSSGDQISHCSMSKGGDKLLIIGRNFLKMVPGDITPFIAQLNLRCIN